VHNTPEGHVTRDYKEGEARLGDLVFRCIDTSGLEPFMAASSLQAGLLTVLMTLCLAACLTLIVWSLLHVVASCDLCIYRHVPLR
jgi:predicted GTPase